MLSLFLCMVGLYWIAKLNLVVVDHTKLRTSKIKTSLNDFCNNYKYGFYIRFWIQAYLEIVISAFITIYSSDLNNLPQAYNFYIALIFYGIFLSTCPEKIGRKKSK